MHHPVSCWFCMNSISLLFYFIDFFTSLFLTYQIYLVWSLYEQVYIAALEFGDIGLVDVCSEALNKRFPDSVRVKRLLGMQYEFNKEYKKALDLYNNLLQSNPSNLLVLKRKVCNSMSLNVSCFLFAFIFLSASLSLSHSLWRIHFLFVSLSKFLSSSSS